MPPYESSIILGNLFSGGILLNEFSSYETHQLIMIFIGSSINVVGILFKLFVMPSEVKIKDTSTQGEPDDRFRSFSAANNDPN